MRVYVCVCVYICIYKYADSYKFIQDPELSEKSDPDPGSDPKKSFRIHNTAAYRYLTVLSLSEIFQASLAWSSVVFNSKILLSATP
jgi:hypothetical protein